MTLYASDLDGTLLRSDTTLSEYTIATLNRLIASGVMLTYASARSYHSASPLLKRLNLKCPAVTFNGVFVVDPATGEHIIENVFPEKSLRMAREFFIEHRLMPLVYSYIDGRERVSYIEDRANEVEVYLKAKKGDKRLRAVRDYGELFEGSVFYFTLLNPSIDTADLDGIFSAENEFSHSFMKDTYDDTMWYEIFDRNASKANALLQVKCLVDADTLVCFGDNLNDLSMMAAADCAVAVGNACEELKAKADRIIGTNDSDSVAEFISEREASPKDRFAAAIEATSAIRRGMHGSVGTQNEKHIHAALKSYYAPFADEQEIKIGKYFADAVCEDGIFEIQTRSLHLLKEKLKAFTAAAHVTVVHPIEAITHTTYINAGSGEIVRQTPDRRMNRKYEIFRELYSIRELLGSQRLTILLTELKVEKRVVFDGEQIPSLRNRSARKKVYIEKFPLELIGEIRLELPCDYMRWLPDSLPQSFTKSELLTLAGDRRDSLRLEVLRSVGIIEQVGKRANSYLYSLANGGKGAAL